MAWTQQDLDNLEAAIALGVLKAKQADQEVEYRSLADMERTRDLIRNALAAQEGKKTLKRRVSYYNSGFYPDEDLNRC